MSESREIAMSLEDKDIWFKRELLDWCWELRKNKTVILLNKNNGDTITLDKVRLMSFMKFAISALDKVRIEEGKLSRIRVKNIKKKVQEKIVKMRKIK